MTVGLFLGPALFVLVLSCPIGGIDAAPHRLLAVLSLVVVFWVTEAIPIAATALLGSVLAVALGIAPAKEVFAPYSDPIIFLFIGSFIIAKSMALHGLDRRFAYFVLRKEKVSQSFGRMLIALGLISAVLSMWMSNTAVAAMMVPFAVCLLGPYCREGETGGPLLGAGALVVAFSCSIGGIATPIGTPPNLITLAFLNDALGIQISFFEWMILGLPVTVLMLMVLLLFLRLRLRGLKVRYDVDRQTVCTPPVRPRLSPGERNTLIVFLIVVALWIIPGFLGIFSGTGSPQYQFYRSRAPEAAVAIFGALLLFFLPVDFKKRKFTISWAEASRINWGTIFLFGGGLSLGTLMFKTGLGEALGEGILRVTGDVPLFTLTLIATISGTVLTEFTSNTAASNIIIPVIISLARALGVPVLPPVLGACFGASMAFMLPISTPPNAIAYSSGYVRITRMISIGIVLDIIGVGVILLVLKAYHALGII